MRLKGVKKQPRVYGPTLMLHVLKAAASQCLPVGFYGSVPEVLKSLVNRMRLRFPSLQIVYTCSPPFRPMTAQEDAEIIRAVRTAGVRILFVGLGCPRQERWIDAHRGKIAAVMIGVGAAFDFHAGFKRQAPAWMQARGLEWLFRLLQEPRRLWKRYLFKNSRFVALALADLFHLSGKQ
jgi:N-acetylglucosaminyldiphosphoundecaprenol N-acetyl-beta-D-mannosaminyltransferase